MGFKTVLLDMVPRGCRVRMPTDLQQSIGQLQEKREPQPIVRDDVKEVPAYWRIMQPKVGEAMKWVILENSSTSKCKRVQENIIATHRARACSRSCKGSIVPVFFFAS